MSNMRRKRSRRHSGGSNIVSAAALIVIAVLLLVFVYSYISNNSIFGVFSDFANRKSDTQSEAIESESESADAKDTQTGLILGDDGKLCFVLTEDEASDYEPEQLTELDGRKMLANSWYEADGALYYFGEDGYALSDYNEKAMQYRFDGDYKLSSIRYNDAYISDEEGGSADYPGVVQTKTLWAFLDTQKTLGDLCAIKYKKTTESFAHSLGGDATPQYSSRFAISIADGYIYYAAFTSGTDKLTESIANKLFRMKPGAEYRELGAENIRGYKLIEGRDGSTRVYYDDGSGIHKATSFEKDESIVVFSEDANYYVEISDGKAMLMMEGGYPVTMESSAFKAGNFTYDLSADGEIKSVATKTTVQTGGYTYTAENGDSFGAKKARILRSANDKTEVISAEFDGSVGNLHYDFASSKIVAEYTDKNGSAGLITVTADGDVDMIYDTEDLGSVCTLYSIQDGYAVVKTANSAEPYKKVKIAASYPIAVGVDPVDISANESQASDTESAEAESTTSSQSGAHGGSTSETAAAPSGTGNKSSAADSMSIGIAEAPTETKIINDHAVEKKGPGVS